MSDTCIHVNIRGVNAGKRCLKKASRFGYCTSHLRSKCVQAQLDGQLPDQSPSPTPTSTPAPAPPTNSIIDIMNSVPKINIPEPPPPPKPVVSKPPPRPKITKKEEEQEKDNAFARSFTQKLSSTLNNSEINDINVYDYYDTPSNPIVDNAVAEDDVEVDNTSPPEYDNPEEDDEDIELPSRSSDPNSVRKRRKGATTTIKTLLSISALSLSNIAESIANPNLDGFTKELLTSPEFNDAMDDLALDLDAELGLTDLSPTQRMLLIGAGIAGKVMITNRYGDPKKLPPQHEEKDDFTPAYYE